jgi:sulfate permease, SulP family
VNISKQEPKWHTILPVPNWLSLYQASWLKLDIVAGVTLAAYAVPISMAYAALAGVPPHHGIYCYVIGGLLYAVCGTSRQLAIGPTSAIALLVGATVAGMADGDAARWTAIAALSALVVAGLSWLAWLLRLSGLVTSSVIRSCWASKPAPR